MSNVKYFSDGGRFKTDSGSSFFVVRGYISKFLECVQHNTTELHTCNCIITYYKYYLMVLRYGLVFTQPVYLATMNTSDFTLIDDVSLKFCEELCNMTMDEG